METRILFSNDGIMEDWTPELSRYQTGTKTFSHIAADDAIYVGSLYLFNHKYIKMGDTVNAEAATIAVKYWDGTEFVSVVNFTDETSALSNSGFLSWTPDEDKQWAMEHTEDITELSTVKIYNMYWLKITFDIDLTASTIINWIGQKFSDDDDLGSEYPELVRLSMITAFKAGQTDWEEQHIKAAELLVRDLVESNVLDNRNQILVRDKFKLAAVAKCAELAFRGFGDDYIDDKVASRQEYDRRRKMRIYLVDKNPDGRLDRQETRSKQGTLSR